MDLADYLNEEVVLYGMAENAMAGAVLRCGTNSYVYIDGLARWADTEKYGAFEVTGVLGEEVDTTPDIPAHLAHARERYYVVKNPVWKRIG
ncbi:hypothetical protein [Nocardia rhamnosiphila]